MDCAAPAESRAVRMEELAAGLVSQGEVMIGEAREVDTAEVDDAEEEILEVEVEVSEEATDDVPVPVKNAAVEVELPVEVACTAVAELVLKVD